MKCREIRYSLADYARGCRDEDKKIRAHLELCPGCRREAESLGILFNSLQAEKPWEPQGQYWINLLPRIHGKIQEKGERRSGFLGYAMPVAALVALVICFFEFVPIRMGEETRTALYQIPQEELADYVEQQSILGASDAPAAREVQAITSVDKALLKEMLKDSSQLMSYVESAQDQVLEALSEQDAEMIVSILERKPG